MELVKRQPGVEVVGGSIGLMAMCQCGNPSPLMLVLTFGQPVFPVECPMCQCKHQLVGVDVDAQEGKASYRIGTKFPDILKVTM